MSVPSEILDEIEQRYPTAFPGVFPLDTDYRKMAEDWVSPERAFQELCRVDDALPIDLSGTRLLEIGSGYGMVVAVAIKEFGIDAHGVEPGEQFAGTYEGSVALLRALGCPDGIVRQGVGEALPYDDASFDVVYSSNVLEHVQDPEQVLREALRVLKPGGYLYVVAPNYGSWWEGHYGILWIPNMPKWLAKLYVRFYRRDPRFIDTLQMINRPWMERMLEAHKEGIEIIGWGEDIWEKRLRSLQFSEWAMLGSLKNMVRWAHRLRLVEPIVLLGRWLHWEHPLILVVRKR